MKEYVISGHSKYGVIFIIYLWGGVLFSYIILSYVYPEIINNIGNAIIVAIVTLATIILLFGFWFKIIVTDQEFIFKKKFLLITYYKYSFLLKDLDVQYPEVGFPKETTMKYVIIKAEEEWDPLDTGMNIILYENKNEVFSFSSKKKADDVILKIKKAITSRR